MARVWQTREAFWQKELKFLDWHASCICSFSSGKPLSLGKAALASLTRQVPPRFPTHHAPCVARLPASSVPMFPTADVAKVASAVSLFHAERRACTSVRTPFPSAAQCSAKSGSRVPHDFARVSALPMGTARRKSAKMHALANRNNRVLRFGRHTRFRWMRTTNHSEMPTAWASCDGQHGSDILSRRAYRIAHGPPQNRSSRWAIQEQVRLSRARGNWPVGNMESGSDATADC